MEHGALDGVTVVAIDDDPNDRFFFERGYEQASCGHKLVCLGGEEEALKFFKSCSTGDGNATDYLVFVDIKMPKLDGFGVIEWLRASKEFSDVPIVVLSSSDLDGDKSRAFALGANSYWRKPNDPNEWGKMIRRCCEELIGGPLD